MKPSERTIEFRPRCQNLRSKEMYHQSPGEEDDQYSSGVFWCIKTHEAFGPDGQPAEKTSCCAGRSCYVG